MAHRNKSDATSREASDEEMNKYIENLKKMGRWPIDVSKVLQIYNLPSFKSGGSGRCIITLHFF